MEGSPTPAGAPHSNARWYALAAGMLAQAAVSSLQQGLPALGPVLRDTFSLSLPALGALLAAASWGVMTTMYLWGRMADAWGERVVVVAGLSGATLALLGALVTDTPLTLGCAIFLAGAMSGSAIAASGRAVMGWFPRSERGLALGLRQMAVPLGAGYSALVLPAAALAYGVGGAFVALAVLSFAGGVLALVALRPPPGAAEPARSGTPVPVRDRAIWQLSSASGLLQWSQVTMNTFLVVILVERQQLGYAAAVALFALVQVLSGVLRVLLGWLSDRSGFRVPHLMRFAVALAATVGLAGLLQTVQSTLSVAALVLATVMSMGWNGLAFASVAELAGHNRAGSALGLHGTLMRAVTIPAALLFGWIAAQAGWTAALLLLAIFPLTGAAFIRPLCAEEERRSLLQP